MWNAKLLDSSDLQTFLCVVEAGGVTRAATVLHRVPSSITSRIARLEEQLGVALFLREHKRMLLTPAGERLQGYAERVCALLQEAENHVRPESPGGLFRLGAMESTAAARLPKPLCELHIRFPQLELELHTGDSRELFDGLLANRLHAVFIADAPEDPRTQRQAVYEEELVLVAPHGQAPVDTALDVCGSTLLAFKEGCAYRKRILNWFAKCRTKQQRIVDVSSYHAILGGVAAGMGIAVVPAIVLDKFADRRLLSVHGLPSDFGLATTNLVWRKGLHCANIAALQACLEEAS